MTGARDAAGAFEELAGGGLSGGERHAWELLERAWPEVLGRIEVFLRSRRLAADLMEDCGQAVLVRVWRFRTGYRGSSTAELSAWMHRIASNEAARAQRTTSRELALSSASAVAVAPDPLEELPDTRPTPQDLVQSGDELTALEQCLEGLDERMRGVVELLFASEPISEREAAEVLGVSKSYVNVLRQKALAALARCLGKKGIS